MTVSNPFWMICRKPHGPNSRTEPKVRYRSIHEARTKAETLARDNDAVFIIVEAVEDIRPSDKSFGLFDGVDT